MLLVDPFTLALQKFVIIVCQPEPLHHRWWVLCSQTLAHRAGIMLYYVAWHCTRRPKMVNVMASYPSAPLIVMLTNLSLYG